MYDITTESKYLYCDILPGKYGNRKSIIEAVKSSIENTCNYYRGQCEICHLVAVFGDVPEVQTDNLLKEFFAGLKEAFKKKTNLILRYIWVREPEKTLRGERYYHIALIWPKGVIKNIKEFVFLLADTIHARKESGFKYFYGLELHINDTFAPYKQFISRESIVSWLSYFSKIEKENHIDIDNHYDFSDIYKMMIGYSSWRIYVSPYDKSGRSNIPVAFSWGIPADSIWQAPGPMHKSTPKTGTYNKLAEEILAEDKLLGKAVEVRIPKPPKRVGINEYIAKTRREARKQEEEEARRKQKKSKDIPVVDVFAL